MSLMPVNEIDYCSADVLKIKIHDLNIFASTGPAKHDIYHILVYEC